MLSINVPKNVKSTLIRFCPYEISAGEINIKYYCITNSGISPDGKPEFFFWGLLKRDSHGLITN